MQTAPSILGEADSWIADANSHGLHRNSKQLSSVIGEAEG